MASDPGSSKKMGISGTITTYNASLFLNTNFSDVTILVENESFPAHKIVLARFDYFRALFLGGLAESTQKEIRLEVGAVPFKNILRYIYHDYLSLESISTKTIIDILHLADMYNLELADIIVEHIKQMLTVENISNILELTRHERLIEACYIFADRNASEFLRHASFQNLSEVSFKLLASFSLNYNSMA